MLPDYEIKSPVALVFGTEKEGISEGILDFSDNTLAIPIIIAKTKCPKFQNKMSKKKEKRPN